MYEIVAVAKKHFMRESHLDNDLFRHQAYIFH